MANYWLCVVIQRIVLPICLGASISFRPCGLSFLYLLLLLALPWVPVATPDTMKKFTGKFWKILLILILLTAVTHLVFHITLLSMPPYGALFEPCNTLEYIVRQIGLVRLDGLTAGETLRWVMPELITLISGVLLYMGITKLSRRGPADTNPLLPLDVEVGTGRIGSGDGATAAEVNAANLAAGNEKEKSNEKMRRFMTQLGRYLLLGFLCIAGSMRPSVPNGVYFLTFLGAATWWSCCRSLGRRFAITCRLFLAPLLITHLVVLYLYQLQVIQDLLPPSSKWTRYFGITQLFSWDCANTRKITPLDVEWASFVNPIAIFGLYYIMILETKLLLKPQMQRKLSKLDAGSFSGSLTRQLSARLNKAKLARSTSDAMKKPTDKWRTATSRIRAHPRPLRFRRKLNETTPLIRGVSPGRRYMRQLSGNPQEPMANAPSNIPEDNIQMQDMNETSEDDNTLLEQIILAVVSMFQVIIMSSYIFTNIIMMTWSITYHSWMTFILLLWANVVWVVPNQRHTMLKTSPLLVFYAQFLLLAQYIYGMDLTEDELPSVISGINMAQIGFERPKNLPCSPLIIKSLFTVMFWITLRQMMQERKQEKRKSTIADMVAPLQLTVGAATSSIPKDEPEMKSKFMQKAGSIIKTIMTKFWIWVVAIMLFVSGVTGQRMTVFRIIYMSLFLIFMLTFQISWKIWRKIMYGFWLTVIIFSMCILIMVYTYQFDNFPEYWKDYLKIPNKLQLDIGLERYQTRELFIKLVTPTFFVIISVVQLHYFHKDFLALSDMKRRTSSVGNRTQFSARSDASSAQGGPFSIYGSEPADVEEPTNKERIPGGLERELSNDSLVIQEGVKRVKRIIYDVYELIFQALELHMVKIIMFSIMLMCIYEVSAVHIIFVVLISLCQLFDSKWQVVVTKLISVLVSILFISKMIYQIEYIEHEDYDVNCTDSTGHEYSYNTAKWIGFEKISTDVSLSNLLHGYIGIIVVTTLNAVITIRQRYHRFLTGKPQKKPYYMFPGITRADADKDVRHCLKYLANFGYYKFGLEISLIATVGLICVRLDAYAIFYGIWLLVLFGLRRRMACRIWPAYVIFIVVVIPLQYCMVVGFPPSLCIPMPWGESDILRNTQEFMFFVDPNHPPAVHKLICDFILLVLVCRQQLVFRIEKRYEGVEYPGGSNSSIVKHAEEPSFTNPVPDYISDLRSWLDVAKRIVFMSFLWISLAIVFLAGSLRVNIFSLGYLIGSFYFLWQGTDLLLRPIPMIIKSWNGLMAFNVSVIVSKAALQIVGCIFINEVALHACWAIQLLGIGCIRKFSPALQFLEPQKCSVPREDIGLAWDGACFAFLILQRKIFKSFYFFHIINEAKAMTMLASRGAELKEELQRKRVAEQEDEEKNILEKIRQKMDRIKANQKRIQGPKFMEKQRTDIAHCTDTLAQSSSMASCTSGRTATPPAGYHTPIDDEDENDENIDPEEDRTEDDDRTEDEEDQLEDDLAPLTPRGGSLLQPPSPSSALMTVSLDVLYGFESRPRYRKKEPKTYLEAIRSGDYYMFDEFDDIEIDLEPKSSGPEDEDEVILPRRLTVSELLHSALVSNIDEATQLHRQRAVRTLPSALSGQTRRSSAPLERHQSAQSYLSAVSHVSAPEPGTAESKDDIEFIMQAKESVAERTLSTHYVPSETGASVTERTTTKTIRRNVFRWLRFIWAFVESLMVSMTLRLHAFSRDYRYVVKVLAREKILLKSKADFGMGIRHGYSMIWTPLPHQASSNKLSIRRGSLPQDARRPSQFMSYVGHHADHHAIFVNRNEQIASTSALRADVQTETDSKDHDRRSGEEAIMPLGERRKASALGLPSIRILAPSLERGLDTDRPYDDSSSGLGVDFHLDDYERADLSSMDKPPFIRLVLSLWYLFLSHTDVACYCMIFLHQIKSANILSLPLPLMVFFWGTLSVPRPSKTFWVTLIAYTQTIVLIKCMFQFEFMPWNSNLVVLPNTPFSPQKIIGIQKKQYYATYDLLLLLVVFFHRGMLKYLGLWNLKQPEEYLEAGEYQMDIESKKTGPDASDFPRTKTISKRITEQHTPRVRALVIPPENKPEEERNAQETDEIELYSTNLDEKYFQEFYNLNRIRSTDVLRMYKKGNRKYGTLLTGMHHKFRQLHSAPGMLDLFKDQDKESGGTDGDDSLKRSLQPSFSGSNTVVVHNIRGDPCDRFPGVLLMAAKKYTDSVKSFFELLLDPALRVTTNVYAAMFICDFYNFLVIIFGFSSFGQGNSSVVEYLEDNKVPIPFLVMIILQFMLILIDRALFLRKCIVGKIIFQYLLVLGVHIWMFFVLPAITERDFNASLLPQMWYMVKCFYLLLSAYQIRCGYPTRILGNFLCKKYNLVNRYLFQIYMLVPWLFELRTIMDWIWTDTSMSMFDWLKMEDIFSTIFQLKCARTFEEQFPVARGMKKKWAVKCLMGGGAVLLIVMIMWFPLVFFAIGNTVGSPNIPYEVTAELRIGSLEPVFKAVAGREDIQQFNERQWQQLSNAYRRDRTAQTFLSNYEYRDASAVSFRSNSLTTWKVAPPDISRLVDDINNNRTIRVTLRYAIRHSVNNPMHPPIIEVEKFVKLVDPVQRQSLSGILTGNTSRAVRIRQLFPKFLKVANKGTATNIVQLMTDPSRLNQPITDNDDTSSSDNEEDEYESEMRNDVHGREYRDVLISLSGSKETPRNTTDVSPKPIEFADEAEKWWSLREFCNTSETFYTKVLEMIPFANCSGYVMYFFNDKIFPAKLNFISGSGIAGIYVSMVFVAWRVSKSITSGGITKIIYDELPNVDRVLQLCLDIYLVRESGDFVLEEDLYAKIVFLFRSPETLIKWSRPVEEIADDEDNSSRRRSL